MGIGLTELTECSFIVLSVSDLVFQTLEEKEVPGRAAEGLKSYKMMVIVYRLRKPFGVNL